jgi:hypothetical protein
LYPQDFKRNLFLRKQIEIILALDTGDESTAETIWRGLHKDYPHLFGHPFNWNGQMCVFSLVVEKLVHGMESASNFENSSSVVV